MREDLAQSRRAAESRSDFSSSAALRLCAILLLFTACSREPAPPEPATGGDWSAFEGGQTPMSMRIPKLPGFNNPNKEEFAIVNLAALDGFDKGAEVTPEELRSRGLIRHRGRVKVLAEGELTKALTVKAHAFSAAARKKIEDAGGTAEVID